MAFVQVLGGMAGFLWLNNRLFNSHLGSGQRTHQMQHTPRVGDRAPPPASSSSSPHHSQSHTSSGQGHGGQSPDADRVRLEFTQFCSDPDALRKFYRQVLAQLLQVEREEGEREQLHDGYVRSIADQQHGTALKSRQNSQHSNVNSSSTTGTSAGGFSRDGVLTALAQIHPQHDKSVDDTSQH